MTGIFMTMSVVTTCDHFISDGGIRGADFSSAADRTHFREFLRSDECDCLVCGLKSVEDYVERFAFKPLFVLTHKPMKDCGKLTYFQDMAEFLKKLKAAGLSKPALLGGAYTFDFFLSRKMVDKAYVVVEKNMAFVEGIKFEFKKYAADFKLERRQNLSTTTEMSVYVRSQ
ncbi:MAG: hypothetical protein LBO78_00120 [Rickettsiales bacterium]|jgi:dihydrofolate reductase|nr:hypothetical protein [Rickettsiales bacterium]